MKKDIFKPLLLRAVLILAAVFGGWMAGQYPAEVQAFCKGVQ